MWSEPILHVDMDSFFVEVERLRDPALAGRAVAVGGTARRGVIASASYEARAFGVRSAQPTATALRLCPGLIVVSPSHGRYAEVSRDVFEVFRSLTPRVEGLSLDEAFLDVSGLESRFDSPVAVGLLVRSSIRDGLGLPASVGVAGTKFVAKLASEAAKPDGIRHVPVDTQLDFLRPLPVTALWGVGPATHAALQRLGVVTVADLSEIPLVTLSASLGPSLASRLLDLSNGVDPRHVDSDNETKSISVEQTYERDLVGRELILTALLSHSEKLSHRLLQSGVTARTISLKVRYDDFRTITRSRTLVSSIDGGVAIYNVVSELAGQVDLTSPVRLLGVSASGLGALTEPRQLELGERDWDRVEDAVAGVRARFGEEAVTSARLAGKNHEDDPGQLSSTPV